VVVGWLRFSVANHNTECGVNGFRCFTFQVYCGFVSLLVSRLQRNDKLQRSRVYAQSHRFTEVLGRRQFARIALIIDESQAALLTTWHIKGVPNRSCQAVDCELCRRHREPSLLVA
jgi:hypothetical protein